MNEEAAVVESVPDDNLNQWPIEISQELFYRLVITQVFAKEDGIVKDGTAHLHVSVCDQYMSGLAFARYMIALKFLVVSSNDQSPLQKNIQNQDLNFTVSKLLVVTPESTSEFNWRIIAQELDKSGIQVDEEVINQICEGDQANVDKLFLRIERYMKVLCGSDFLNFENVEPEHFHNMADLYLNNSLGDFVDIDSQDIESPDNLGMRHKSIDNSHETITVHAPSNLIETRLVGESQQNPLKKVKEGVDIVTVQIDRPLSDTENSLEFLLVTLSRAFQLSPRQSASLLTNNNQYLISACIKGIKGGSYEPLLSWYKELISNVQILVELLRAELNQFKDQIHVTKVLSSISCGLFSQNEEIAKKGFNLLIECFYFFAEDKSLNAAALHWFLSTEDGGLKRSIYSLRLHVEVASHFVGLCNGFCSVDQQLLVLYKEEVMTHCKQTFDYVRVINDILEPLCNTKDMEVAGCGLLSYWIELCVRESENDGKHTVEERVAALSLLTQIWLNFQDYVSLDDERANSILYMLKRACREQNRCVKITTTAFLFRLLDSLSEQRNRSAPIIYKTLVFNLVENPSDSTVRELYLRNFQELFRNQPSIPIGLLLEPLLKQIQTQIGLTYHLKTFDFDFFNFVANHQKLNANMATQLLDFFSKLYLSEVTTCTAIQIPFIAIVKRFCEEADISEVTRQVTVFIELALQQLYEIEEQLNLQGSPSGTYQSNKSSQTHKIRALRQSANRSIANSSKLNDPLLSFKRQLIVTMIKKLQQISNESIQQNLAEQLRQLQSRVIQEFEKQQTVVDTLLEFYGTSTLLVPKPPSSEPQTRPVNSRSGKLGHLDSRKLRKISAEKPIQAISSNASEKTDAVVPYAQKPISKNQANRQKAIQELEIIRKQKAEKEDLKRQEEAKMKELAEKKKQNLRRQIQKRNYELGVGRDSADIPIAVVTKGQESVDDTGNQQLNGVQWLDLDDEEDSERDAFNLLMKKYAKLWRVLFNKYANAGFKVKSLQERNSFEGLKQQQEQISLAEVTKLMKDYNIYPQMIGKDDLLTLIRLVNMRMGAASLLTFDYSRYLVFISQASVNIYFKVQTMVFKSPSYKLQSFISQVEAVSKSKNQLSALFEELQGGKDLDKITLLNNRLLQDPNYPLPEGYIKYREKGIVNIYEIDAQTSRFVGESNCIAYSLVDDLLSRVFGFHVIEPKTLIKDQVKAKSVFQKASRSDTQEKVVEERQSNMKKATQLEPLVPKISENLIALAAASKDPDLYFEMASIVENILQAVERQYSNTQMQQNPIANNKRTENYAIQLQKEKEEQFRLRELSREKKRKERDAKIKSELERLKEQKAEEKAQLEAQKQEKARAEKLAEKKKQEAVRRSIQRIIDEAQATKDRKPEVERSTSNQNARLKSKPPSKEQIERISGNHELLMRRLQEQKVMVVQKEEEVRQRDFQLKEAIKKKAELALQLNKDQKLRDILFQSQLQDFLLTEPVVQVYAKYNTYLDHMFKFYCSQGKVDLGVDLKFKQKHMDQKEFIKFGYQSKVVPVLVTSDELIQIFKVLCKIHSDISEVQSSNLKSVLGNTIDFATFKEAIARICIYGYQKMGGISDEQAAYRQEFDLARKNNEAKIRDLIKKKEQDRKALSDTVLAEMRLEFQEKIRRAREVKETGRSPSVNKGLSQSRSEVSIGQQKVAEGDKVDELEFKKWLKQQENIGNGLQKRVEQRVGSQTDLNKSSSSNQLLLKQRQTVHQKQIEKLENEALMKQRLGKDDIRDNRQVTREMDIKLISAATIETFLTFIGAMEGEVSVYEMDQKFNAQRIEVQGQKPAKNIKNLMLPKCKLLSFT